MYSPCHQHSLAVRHAFQESPGQVFFKEVNETEHSGRKMLNLFYGIRINVTGLCYSVQCGSVRRDKWHRAVLL